MANTAITSTWEFGQRARNFAASFVFVTCAFLAYRYSPHSAGLRQLWNERLQVSGTQVLTVGCAAYSLLLLIFYCAEGSPRISKSILALRALRALATSPARTLREGLPYDDRLGLLTILLKGFFAPLMVLSLFDFTGTMIANGAYVVAHASAIRTDFLRVFNAHGFWFLFQLILFLDVLFFTVGYLVEHPALGNEIRSVDPTWLGWAVALACYPPLNGLTNKMLGWSATDFPQFGNPVLHVAVSSLLLILMAIYVSASVALNLKASNLTHRGIIDHGPYRFVRHPAYVCKNLAWWLGSIPAIATAWDQRSAVDALLVATSTAAWTGVYVLRAVTEEDHLRRVDGEYDAYRRKVRYRFVPRIC
jgi:protein-S-isoprenylcysteine O-methyltransferase Ste14